MSFHALYEAGFVTTIPITPPDCPLAPGTKLRPQDRGKVPGLRNGTTDWWGFDWIRHETVPADLDKWTAIGAGVGLRTRDFPAVDVDVLDERLSALVQALVQERLGWAPVRVGRTPKAVLAYRTAEPFKRRRMWFRVPGMAKRQLVEVLGDGQQYVVEGLHAELRRPYVWDIELEAVGAAGLTAIDREQVEGMLGALRELLEREGCTEIELEGSGAAKGPSPPQEELAAPWEQVALAVSQLPNTNEHFPSRTDYLTVGYAIKAAVGERGRELFFDWAERWEGNADFPHGNSLEDVDSDWSRMKPPFQVGAPYLFERAQALGGYRWAAEEFADIAEPMPEGGVVPGGDQRAVLRLGADWINDTVRASARLLDDVLVLRGPVAMAVARVELAGHQDVIDDEVEPGVVINGVRHTKGGLLFIETNPALVGYHLDDRAVFESFSAQAKIWKPKSCPPEICKRLISAATELGFRACKGVVRVPLLLGEKVVGRSGYDRRSGLMLDLSGHEIVCPENPGKEDAEKALDVMLAPFQGYLTGDDEEYTKWLRVGFTAAVLTAVLRPSLATAPALLLDANIAGAGKGKAARALAHIATGRLPSIITEGHNAEEMEKRIASAILSGSPAILLDNLRRPVNSSTLESCLTEGVATIRRFGTLTESTVPCSALIVITANNASFHSDMNRRMLPLRILADTDRPEARKFTFDPYEEAKTHRREIVTAALTVAVAWRRWRRTEGAGTKIGSRTMGSFEEWAELVAGATEWLTGRNPIGLLDKRLKEDPSHGSEKTILELLLEFQNQQEAEGAPGHFTSQQARLQGEGMWAELLTFNGDYPSAAAVGWWLRQRRDRMFGEMCLTRMLDRKNIWKWRIVIPSTGDFNEPLTG